MLWKGCFVVLFIYFTLVFCDESNILESNIIDPILHKVSIHFAPKEMVENERQAIEQISLEHTKFNCQVPLNKEKLPKLYPPTDTNKTIESLQNFDRSQRSSPLSEEEMEVLSKHFAVLHNRCHLDLVNFLPSLSNPILIF